MGSFQSPVPVSPPRAVNLYAMGIPPSSLVMVDAGTDDSYVKIKLDAFNYVRAWGTAHSKGKTNLLNPSVTQCNDGNTSTYYQSSTTSTSYVDDGVKIDMEAVSTYMVAYKVGLWNSAGYSSYCAIAGSPDNVNWTIIVEIVDGGSAEGIKRGWVMASGYRYFKTMQKSAGAGSTNYMKIYEIAIWDMAAEK